MNTKDVKEKIEKLPHNVIPEVNDFIDFLLNKYGHKNNIKSNFKFDWEGGLSRLKKKYNSVELQHKASEWR